MKNKLYFFYGGFRGPNYEIKYKDKRFHISLGEISSQNIFYVSYPDEQKWDNFWYFVNRHNIWFWKKEYFDENVLDGIQWEIKLSNSSNRVKSYGSNKFPNKRDFKKLINQIEILLDFKLKKLKDEFNEYKIEYQNE